MAPILATNLVANPVFVLFSSMALVIVLIGVCRVHAFISLMLGAGYVAVCSAGDAGWSKAIDGAMESFGASAGGIGFSIAVAAVIGAALMESGAADKIVRRFLAVLGEQRAPIALMASGFVLSIPVFFDTMFFLLVPLVRALTARTGKRYVLHLMAVVAGGVITHATVPPTPGPLAMADNLHLDLGLVMLAGLAAGILPAVGGYLFSWWSDARNPIPLRAVAGSSLDAVAQTAQRDESELPGFFASIAPVLAPIVLIAIASVADSMKSSLSPGLVQAAAFVGNKNVAMLAGAVIAVAVYLRQKQLGWRETEPIVGEPLLTAGVIILITAAGGAYGAMLRNAGIGEVVKDWATNLGLNILVVAWGLAALLRAAQGSTTVAVTTTSSLMMSMAGAAGFGVHPIYLYVAIGYGGLAFTWMNDSGFWIYSRMSGLNERETLRTWSVLLTLIAVLGLVEVLAVSAIFPGLG